MLRLTDQKQRQHWQLKASGSLSSSALCHRHEVLASIAFLVYCRVVQQSETDLPVAGLDTAGADAAAS